MKLKLGYIVKMPRVASATQHAIPAAPNSSREQLNPPSPPKWFYGRWMDSKVATKRMIYYCIRNTGKSGHLGKIAKPLDKKKEKKNFSKCIVSALQTRVKNTKPALESSDLSPPPQAALGSELSQTTTLCKKTKNKTMTVVV